MIAEYISEKEYQCQHCGKLPPGMKKDSFGNWNQPFSELFDTFKKIRERWGNPIIITSGYRCPYHEIEVSGHELTTHVFGLALDIVPTDADEMENLHGIIVSEFPYLRIGINYGNHHIHLDSGYRISPIYSEFLVPGARWIE